MTLDAYPGHDSEPELINELVKFVGGSAAVTKVFGRGATVTYISTGVVDVGFAENPGTFLGVSGNTFEATTISAVAGYNVAAGVFNTTTLKLRLNITNASDALADLAALQWLTLNLAFQRTGA